MNEFIQGTYSVIYADPPWTYHCNGSYTNRRNQPAYSRMSISDICQLPVEDIAAEHSYLWLWATSSHLLEAGRVMGDWGFTYKKTFTWVKSTKAGAVRMGMGDWGRCCSEFLLLGIRGAPPSFGTRGNRAGTAQKDVILHPPTRINSEKPLIFREMIDRLCPQGDRVELFARRTGGDRWATWGDEVGVLDAS